VSEEELKRLVERIRDKHYSVTISFRVPYMVKLKYDALGRDEKRLIRDTVVRLVEKSFDELVVERKPTAYINININYNRVEARAENSVDVHIDLGEAVSLLREMKQLLYNWHRSGLIPRAAYGSAYGKLKQLEKILVKRN